MMSPASNAPSSGSIRLLAAALLVFGLLLITIPAGIIVGPTIEAHYLSPWEGWTATNVTREGDDLVIVGTVADDDEFASGVDVASVGVKHPTTIQTSNGAYMAAATDVYVKYTDENSNAGAGAATVVVVFISRVG